MKLFLILCLVSSLVPIQTYADGLFKDYNVDEDVYKTRLSEYFYNQSRTDVLVPVKLLGQVKKPGLYHIPATTDLTTLLTIAGGPENNADVSSIAVATEKGVVHTKDLRKLMRTGHDYQLRGGDTIYIPEKEYFFDNKTVNAFSVVTGVVSLLLTAIIVNDQLRN